MKLVFAPLAEEQAEACDTWWREHRPRSRDLFARELASARALLLRAPDVGVLHGVLDGQPVRRILLEKTRTHVYYAVDAVESVVTILAVWGAPRGRGPDL